MEAKSFLLTSHLLSVKISMFNGSREKQKQQSSKFAINTVRFSVNKGKCSLETSEAQSSSGYAMGPPWFFKGSALYQLHLVKTEVARSFIPKEFKLVEAFGYTLGGFFLASYDDSPVAKFDELVVIAGIVWNPPTSCAWAARVLVNNEGACRHGRTEIGLPSNVGIFSKQRAASKIREKFTGKHNNFLSMIGINSTSRKEHIEVKISEVNDFNIMPLCSIDVPSLDPKLSDDKWMGPKIKLSLPSFSGRTIHHPPLLKYICQIECRIRVISVAKVSRNTSKHDDDDSNNDRLALAEDAKGLHKCISIMLSKPVLALEFNFLKMQVDAPMMVLDDLGTLSRD